MVVVSTVVVVAVVSVVDVVVVVVMEDVVVVVVMVDVVVVLVVVLVAIHCSFESHFSSKIEGGRMHVTLIANAAKQTIY